MSENHISILVNTFYQRIRGDEIFGSVFNEADRLINKTPNADIRLTEKGYKISNIDATIALEKPKVNPYIPQMKKVLASCMGIDEDDLSIKATTTEKLGFEGREEGVSAYATVLIYKD